MQNEVFERAVMAQLCPKVGGVYGVKAWNSLVIKQAVLGRGAGGRNSRTISFRCLANAMR